MTDTRAQAPVSGVLAQLLRENRERCNARFIEARRYKSRIDAAAFTEFLSTTLAPVLEAFHAVDSARTPAVFDALYDLALDLLGQELLGPRSRCPQIEEGWRLLLPQLATAAVADPRKVAGALSNAIYNLHQTPGAWPGEWIGRMAKAGRLISDGTQALRAGQIAAWQAGLAHYRFEALALLEQESAANDELASTLLGLPPTERSSVPRIIARLKENPWLTVQAARDGSGFASTHLKLVRRIGAFKGFGGVFMAPPCIAYDQGQFVVGDGHATWVLSADAFGATLLKWPGGDCVPRRHAAHGASGNLRLSGSSGSFPEFKTVLSAADDGRTLAVTVPHSHTIALLAAVS